MSGWGKKVLRTLGSAPAKDPLPWLSAAIRNIGVLELAGIASNPLIDQMHEVAGLDKADCVDATPWCGSFLCWIFVGIGAPRDTLPGDAAWARSWLEWGDKLPSFKKGCVVVYSRDGGGHVHIGESENSGSITGVGGNQNDSVCRKAYSKEHVLGYRWPSKAVLKELGL